MTNIIVTYPVWLSSEILEFKAIKHEVIDDSDLLKIKKRLVWVLDNWKEVHKKMRAYEYILIEVEK